jgi:PhoPQ-activated pathogenicity-related protein
MLKLVQLLSTLFFAQAIRFTPKNFVKPVKQHIELFDFVSTPDSSFEYFHTGQVLNLNKLSGNWLGYVLNITSQTWRSLSEVSISKWTHKLVVIVPDDLKVKDQGLLYLTGGDNVPEDIIKEDREDVILVYTMALRTHSITAAMFQIPNQPIVFRTDPIQKQRHEDAIVGYTWLEFFRNTSRSELLSHLPMTKAGVRGMDTIQHFCEDQGFAHLDKFVVAGASKRGWTTWLVGAVDTRVKAIIPVVMDLFYLQENLVNHYRSLGGWSFAFQDYHQLGLTGYVNTPLMNRLSQVIDPATYISFLDDIPKLVIGTTGDEFFLLSDDHLWWDQFNPENIWRLLIPNAEHTLDTGILTTIDGVSGFYDAILSDSPIPIIKWKMVDQHLILTLENKPVQAYVRQATTTHNRDFRLVVSPMNCSFIKVGEYCVQLVLWSYKKLENKNNYTIQFELPDKGYTAGLIELRFSGTGMNQLDFILTTQAIILPDTYPFPAPCDGELGVLV